eukprot:TRINITY_DN1439_c0_g2_i1.p4 TRINITY_DN1439_c0_g2~~TRINITY_DN1439_c0_g2_i1.p4  ORF type:complete len:116 (+),score=27.04 TRINITY_DN1439_c0_g2_i1:141-488(+)
MAASASAQGGEGIQKLLAAEAEAQKVVEAARKNKAERLRQAKEEAEKELASFRAECEAAYQKKSTEGTKDSSTTFASLEKDASVAVSRINAEVAAKKSQVVDMLAKMVCNVKIKA